MSNTETHRSYLIVPVLEGWNQEPKAERFQFDSLLLKSGCHIQQIRVSQNFLSVTNTGDPG